MRLILVEKPGAEPLTATEARARLAIDSEVADAVIDALITAARTGIDGVDGWLGRAIMTQTWRLLLDGFPAAGCAIAIPLPPLQQINSISYIDGTGDTVTLGTGDYQVMQGPRPAIHPPFGKSWPPSRIDPDSVIIEFDAGYGDSGSDVPEPIRCAIALQVGYLRSLMSRNLFISAESVTDIEEIRYVVGPGAGDVTDRAVADLLRPYRVLA